MAEERNHPDIFTAEEAAAYLRLDGVGYEGVFDEMIRRGCIKRGNVEGIKLFWKDDLDDLVLRIFCRGPYEGKEPLEFTGRTGSATIYMLYDQDELVYIGQTINAAQTRTKCHRKDKTFDRVVNHTVPRADVDAIERGLIALHKPRFNKAHKDARPDRYMTLLKARGFHK